MSFFKELKEDIVQSVNELGDSLEETVGEGKSADMDVVEEPLEDKIVSEYPNEDVEKEPEDMEESFVETESEEESAEEPQEEIPSEISEEDMKKEIQKELSNILQGDSRFQDEEISQESQDDWQESETIEESVADEAEKEEMKDMEEPIMSDYEETTVQDFDPEETTVITKGTTISGGIKSDTALIVKGVIEGDVECLGKLTITGRVSGNSIASEIYVNTPRLEGNLESRGSVKVDVGTVIIGSITSSSVVIAGAVKGDIDVNGPVVIDSTAVVKGNIVAKAIQLNSGAVFEGSCELKYADVDLDSFFE